MEYNYIKLYWYRKYLSTLWDVNNILNNICCFLGHRKIKEKEKLKEQLYEIIESLIIVEKINTFLFGSKSEFDSLCYEVVTQMKTRYPHITRIYVRAEYPNISENYNKYLLNYYESSYYPQKIKGATKAVYIKRNYEMIDRSRVCLIYYEKEYCESNKKSGTKIALDYAIKHKKKIHKLPK